MIQERVHLVKDTHQYFNEKKETYSSVSSVIAGLKEPFDEDFWAWKKSTELGITKEEVKQMWKETRENSQNHGNKIHDAIEVYTKFGTIEPDNMHLEAMLKSIASEYTGYVRTYSECALYSPVLEKLGTRVAGMTDRIMLLDKKMKYIDLEDYKTNVERGIQFFPQKKDGSFFPKQMYAPVEHLTDCNFHHYTIQISIYALMAEQLTGAKIRQLWLRYIPKENPLMHNRIPVPYMRTDAINILNDFHNKRIAKKEKVVSEEEQEMPNFNY